MCFTQGRKFHFHARVLLLNTIVILWQPVIMISSISHMPRISRNACPDAIKDLLHLLEIRRSLLFIRLIYVCCYFNKCHHIYERYIDKQTRRLGDMCK